MKKLLLIALLLPTLSFASGKITIQPGYYLGSKKVMPMGGLGIYEHLVGPLYYNSWTGAGLQPRNEGNLLWLSSKHDLEMYFGKVAVAVGVTYRKAEKGILEYPDESDVHVKLTYQIWD